ncbi:MAG: hypothetical protein ACREOE_19850, partial [Gemmatimonadales bacterium]
VLPIRANFVQCGSRHDLPAKCREDQRCCALLDMTGASPLIGDAGKARPAAASESAPPDAEPRALLIDPAEDSGKDIE